MELPKLLVSLERSIQTFAVLFTMTAVFSMSSVTAVVLCLVFFYTKYYYLSVLYVLWMWYDSDTCERGGRRVQWVRKWRVWGHFSRYFPVKLVKLAELHPSRNYIFACHPHGVFPAGIFANFATEATGFSETFPGLVPHLVTLQLGYNCPGFRELYLCSGAVFSSKKGLHYLLTSTGGGHAAALIVGGAYEMVYSHPGRHQLVLKRRKGFIRMAMQTGASIVPVYSFGENDIFDQVSNPEGSLMRRIQDKMHKITGMAMPIIFFGRGMFNCSFGFLPFRAPIHTVVGEPMHIEKNSNPTQEEVDKVHNEYIKALTQLFESQKAKYSSDPNAMLIIS